MLNASRAGIDLVLVCHCAVVDNHAERNAMGARVCDRVEESFGSGLAYPLEIFPPAEGKAHGDVVSSLLHVGVPEIHDDSAARLPKGPVVALPRIGCSTFRPACEVGPISHVNASRVHKIHHAASLERLECSELGLRHGGSSGLSG